MSTALLKQIEEARRRWVDASTNASAIACEVLQPDNGYGCPDAMEQDRHKRDAALNESERAFREYDDLSRRYIQEQMLQLQRSQLLATWASFAVAAVVGLSTIVDVVFKLLK